MAVGKKQIAFDLDIHILREYYPNGSYENAYKEIRNFMKRHEFYWQQGSVYVSKNGITMAQTSYKIKQLVGEQPWLNMCMRDCAVTNIGKTHIMNHLFDKEAKVERVECIKKVRKKLSR